MCAKAVKGPSLARSVPKPLKGPSLARSVPKPLKVPSLARSVPKAFKMEQEGEGAKRHYFVPRDSLTLRCRPPTPLVILFQSVDTYFENNLVFALWVCNIFISFGPRGSLTGAAGDS